MSKYKNKYAFYKGKRFDSKKEANRFLELSLLEQAKQISNLKCQVAYQLKVDQVIIGKYICDFEYEEKGKTVTEDVKSAFTKKLPLYRWKKKHFQAQFGREVRET
tara:strand:- start:65 stop:379 length:315 start_codon:yes stop_codon:yes gene_type:complete